MDLFWKLRIQKLVNFFSRKNASEEQTRIAKLEGQNSVITQHLVALQAQFKYLQQRLDKMEIPR